MRVIAKHRCVARRALATAVLGFFLLTAVHAAAAAPQPVQDPPMFASQNGSLSVLMVAAKRPGVLVGTVTTDLWTYEICRLPAPGAEACPAGAGYAGLGGVRLSLQPGDTLRVRLVNRLPALAQDSADHPALAGNPTNLHTHGLIVEPHRAVGPSDTYGDYVFLELRNPANPTPAGTHPGTDVVSNAVEYLYKIEATHPTGLFWFHPHLHGLALNQVTAGMAGVLTLGTPEDACNDPACVAAVQRATVRHLVLKDTQVERGGVLKTQQEPNFCAGAPTGNRQGSCPGQFFDPADPDTDFSGGTWLHTVNGQVYPQIDVGASGDVWRIVNASGSRSYDLSLAVQPTGQLLAFQLLAIDGVAITTRPGASAATVAALLYGKAVLAACPGAASFGIGGAVCATSIRMMPSSRIEVRVVRGDTGAQPAAAVLRTARFDTGDNGAGDQWPAIDLAAVTLAPRDPGAPNAVALKDVTTAALSSSGQLLASSVLQVPGTDTLVAATAADAVVTQPSGPALQSVKQALGVAITPDLAAGRIPNPNCRALAAGHRRKILFGFPKPTTFGLGYVEADQNGNDIEATRVPIGEFDPAQTVICVPLPGGIATYEVWELVNLTDEDHNFHIHQTRFFLMAGGVAPGTTIPALFNGNLVLHDNVPVPRPTNGAPCADGTLEAVKRGACKPTSTFVVIPFREIGDFVFHCHILEHEDGGMMARIRVVLSRPGL